jgi:hypothetical protein
MSKKKIKKNQARESGAMVRWGPMPVPPIRDPKTTPPPSDRRFRTRPRWGARSVFHLLATGIPFTSLPVHNSLSLACPGSHHPQACIFPPPQYSSLGDLTWVPSKPTPLMPFSHLRTLSRYHCTSPFRSCSPLNSTMLVIIIL